MTRDATGAAIRVGLSSYHRMKQRAEIAEFEEARLGMLLAERGDEVTQLNSDIDALLQVTGSVRAGPHSFTVPLRGEQRTWRHDFGSVVGGVLLAAGLIAAIVWGVWF